MQNEITKLKSYLAVIIALVVYSGFNVQGSVAGLTDSNLSHINSLHLVALQSQSNAEQTVTVESEVSGFKFWRFIQQLGFFLIIISGTVYLLYKLCVGEAKFIGLGFRITRKSDDYWAEVYQDFACDHPWIFWITFCLVLVFIFLLVLSWFLG